MLYAIRHVKTIWNEKWLCQWRKSWRILTNSYSDIDICIDELQLIDIDAIISSDLIRAKKTALYIKHKLLFKKNIKYYGAFREMNFGIFEWIHFSYIRLDQPNIYDENWFFKHFVALKKWESVDDLRNRVMQWLQLIEWLQWNILLVAHWNVIRMIYSLIFKKDYNEIYTSIDIDKNIIHNFSNAFIVS